MPSYMFACYYQIQLDQRAIKEGSQANLPLEIEEHLKFESESKSPVGLKKS